MKKIGGEGFCRNLGGRGDYQDYEGIEQRTDERTQLTFNWCSWETKSPLIARNTHICRTNDYSGVARNSQWRGFRVQAPYKRPDRDAEGVDGMGCGKGASPFPTPPTGEWVWGAGHSPQIFLFNFSLLTWLILVKIEWFN